MCHSAQLPRARRQRRLKRVEWWRECSEVARGGGTTRAHWRALNGRTCHVDGGTSQRVPFTCFNARRNELAFVIARDFSSSD
jgi:hypothetical protein